MKIFRKIILFLGFIPIIFFLGGCSRFRSVLNTAAKEPPEITRSSPYPTTSPNLTTTIENTSPGVIPTSTPFVTPEIQGELKLTIDCLTISYEGEKNLNLPGRLVVQDLPLEQQIQLLDLTTGELLEVTHDESTFLRSPSVSPDQKWLVYKEDVNSTFNKSKLILTKINGMRKNEIVWQSNWISIAGWFNNDWIWIDQKKDEQLLLLLYNPFNGQKKELPSTFPNIRMAPPPFLYFWGRYSISQTVYDPTLTRVVYPENSEGTPIVLWDFEKNEIIKRIPTNNGYGFTPIWFSDSQKFITSLAGKDPKDPSNVASELYSISRDGIIDRLTYLTTYYKRFDISTAAISPVGDLIAFLADPGDTSGLITYHDKESHFRLFVYNVNTGDVINYCIPADNLVSPLWSLDNRYLVIGDQGAWNTGYQYIVDLKNRTAYLLSERSVRLAGWLMPDQ